MLRHSNGVGTYFQDGDGDGVYKAFAPATDTSVMVKQADGTFAHKFRAVARNASTAPGS
jgi:hypothetical protein